MRIIAGSRKGHGIAAPRGRDTRPTGDRVREATFSLIGPVDEMRVLDLFAGSGALGLEALSRGAAHAVFVDNDREACRTIERNLDKLRLVGAAVICRDALQVLAAEASAQRRYDLVFVDPPYEMYSSVEATLARYLPDVVADEGGILAVETAARVEPALPLQPRTSRRYGAARVTVYER